LCRGQPPADDGFPYPSEHPLRIEHHVLPGDPQDQPARSLDVGIATTVTPQRCSVAVMGEALALDHDPKFGIGKVDPAEEASVMSDVELRGEPG